MRLKRLELAGFKSFLDKTILTFDPGITGVVGPNGCGKSNIVDAIQWVMGEQSAKHLRGDSMTDVIFSGSDTRQPTSMAEVSLILDRQGVQLAPQFSAFDKGEEIQITRRVYRDGTGEYLINKVGCRLKDIHELFMDTGVGKRAYSIIEQGQIDRMINVKPEERRLLFEEVAGITKYKAKRREAEKKVEMTRQNLTRLFDIVQELEKQIRSLKVQATRAKRFRELKTELESVDLFLLGRNLFEHKKNIDELTERQNSHITERTESDASLGQLDAGITQLEVKRLDEEKLFHELTQKERDLSLAIQRIESQFNILEERVRHLSESIESNQLEQREVEDSLKSLTEEVEREEEEKAIVAKSLSFLKDEMSDSETQLRDRIEDKNRSLEQRESLLKEKYQTAHRKITLDHQNESHARGETEFLERRQELNLRLTEILMVIEHHKEALQKIEGRIEECNIRANNVQKDVADAHSEYQVTSQRLGELEKSTYKVRESYHAHHSRLGSLRELQENMEGYSSSAQEILLCLEGELTPMPLAEVITPLPQIEDHVEILLGNEMNTLIVKNTEEAKKLTQLILDKGLERVRIVALEELNSPVGEIPVISDATPLLQSLRVKPGYDGVAETWFGKTYLVQTQEKLFELRKLYPTLTFLAIDTKTVADSDASLASGTMPTKTGVFARRREIEELEVTCQALDSELSKLQTERDALLDQLKNQEKLHGELKDRLSSIHIENVELRKEKEKIQLEAARTERDFLSLNKDSDRNHEQLESIRQQKKQVLQELEDLSKKEVRIQNELEGREAEILRITADYERLVLFLNEKKVEESRFTERFQSLEYKVEKLSSEIEELLDRKDTLHTQEEKGRGELKNIQDNQSEIKAQQEKSVLEKNETLVQLSDTQTAFAKTTTSLQDLKNERAELHKKRENILSELQEIELKLTHEKSNFEHLCGISIERYQREPQPLEEGVAFDLNLAPLFMSELGVEWAPLPENEKKMLLEEHLKNIREKISRYGEVNLTAIQEFEEVQKRYDFLTEQRSDLEKSIGILEEAIKKIDETTKSRFTETFEAVSVKFKEIFPILFNGGKAEITLVTSEGQLDPGVEIMAQPPGKRLQSINLLSGGEKALTAVSLVLAIFARKPSPFCLLDEVDAPLDDANVSRFNTVVKKMAEKTQFIVITHNKKTMEIAEALYGVTMERAGVSKMTSVRLN